MNIRKITAMAGSMLMAGLTVTTAAAAAFPAPFVQNGVGDVAVVYGASSLDAAASTNVQTALSSYATAGSISVDGGEAYALEKSSNNFNFGDALNATDSTLNDDDLDFLADGTYDDGDIDTDFEQSITLGSKTLGLFADTDYNNDEPTIGFHWTNNELILSYTIDFDDEANYTEMVETEMPLLGSTYYVLSASSTAIEVLDTAEKHTLELGETATIAGKEVTVSFIGTNGVRFTVDGENTDSLGDNEEYELDDGSYIIPTTILTSSKDSVTDSVEFSIGSGKITFTSGSEVEISDEDVDGLEATIVGTTGLDTLTLTWKSDRDTFLTEEDSISMPGLGVIQLAYGGLSFPTDSETVALQNGETLTLVMDNYELPVMWWDKVSDDAFLGEEDNLLVLATSVANYTDPAANLTGGLDLKETDRFLVTLDADDVADIETMYYEVNVVENDSGDILVELIDLIGSKDITFDEIETKTEGSITVSLDAVNGSIEGARAYLTFTATDGVEYNRVFSDKGLAITLPAAVSTLNTSTPVIIGFQEADNDGDLELGESFNASVQATSNDKLHVVSHTVDDEEESDDNLVGYVVSDLASKVMFDTSADENDFSVEYYGEEVVADVQVVVGGEISSSDSLGNVMITANEVADSNAANLVIVGGSCINSAAATVLGGAYCGAAFTDATGVGAGEFMIKGIANSAIDGKFALVVAGYEAADTTNAVTYLTNKRPDTSKEWKGTTATEQAVDVTSN